MDLDTTSTALVVIDPQMDVLSEQGLAWSAVGESVVANHTVANLEALMRTAGEIGLPVFISPHYLYPADQLWPGRGAAEAGMLEQKEFFRPDPLTMDGFAGSGADWVDELRPYIDDSSTVVVNPHKLWGPQNNDLCLQLGKRHIRTVVLAGMMANLCVESHLRDLLESGVEVCIASDATAGPRDPDLGDGYEAALVNFRYIATSVLSTAEVIEALAPRSER